MDIILYIYNTSLTKSLLNIYEKVDELMALHKPSSDSSIFYLLLYNYNEKSIKLIDYYMKNLINYEYHILPYSSFPSTLNNKYILITTPEVLTYDGLYTTIINNKNSKITFNVENNNFNITHQYYKKRYINELKNITITPSNDKISSYVKYYYERYKNVSTDKVFKSAITDIGKELIKHEVNWYKYILNNNIDIIPKVYELYDYGYLMENTLIYQNNQTPNIKSIIDFLSNLHNNPSYKKTIIDKNTFFSNLKNEIYDKINKIEIKPILEYYNEESNKISEILITCKNIITQFYTATEKYEYSLIHGKPFISNIIFSELTPNSIKLINPRGYFGKTPIFGPEEYDYGALLSSLYDVLPLNEIWRYFNKVHIAFSIIIAYGELKNYINDPELLYNLYKKIIVFSDSVKIIIKK